MAHHRFCFGRVNGLESQCNCADVKAWVERERQPIERVRQLAQDMASFNSTFPSQRVSDLIIQALDTKEEWLVLADESKAIQRVRELAERYGNLGSVEVLETDFKKEILEALDGEQ